MSAYRPETLVQGNFSWSSWLGSVAIVFGIALAAAQATELLKQAVSVTPAIPSDQVSSRDCRADEIEEEGLTFAQCRQMVANVESLTLSRPGWFRGVEMGLAGVATIIAVFSIVVGLALFDRRSWAPTLAVLTFAALAGTDSIGFIAAVRSGPIIRQLYLWNIVLWFLIHLVMTVAAVAGRESERAGRQRQSLTP